jgi:hypothetical protein
MNNFWNLFDQRFESLTPAERLFELGCQLETIQTPNDSEMADHMLHYMKEHHEMAPSLSLL